MSKHVHEGLTSYATYLAKYLGVALVSGSVVHIGTLSNGIARYVVLACIGLALMMVGNIVEAKKEGTAIDASFVVLITFLALATGFLSGGIQHYLDNPVYAGYLLAVGLVVSLVTFFKKEGHALPMSFVVGVVLLAGCIVGLSTYVAPEFSSEHAALGEHH